MRGNGGGFSAVASHARRFVPKNRGGTNAAREHGGVQFLPTSHREATHSLRVSVALSDTAI